MTYVAFRPPRSVREYRGQKGNETNGQRLPWMVQDSLGVTIPADLPDEFVVIGERTADGEAFLDFGVTTAYIEAVTDCRWDERTKRLRLRCPACLTWDGKHTKGCTR